MSQPFIYKPASGPLVSNVYTSLESFRRAGVISSSEDDEDHHKYKSHANPLFAASDVELLDEAYRQSRWIDKACGVWFYPRELSIPFSHIDMHHDELWLPAPVVNPLEAKLDLAYNTRWEYDISRNEYHIHSSEQDIERYDVKLVINHALIARIERTANMVSTAAFPEWEYTFYNERYEWFEDFQRGKHLGVLHAKLGFLEHGGVPEPIQKVCRYLAVKEISGERSGDIDGDLRAFLKSEVTDGHSYTLDSPRELAQFRGGVALTGVHWVDVILAGYMWHRPAIVDVI